MSETVLCLTSLIEVDHANESMRVVFSTTDHNMIPDAACNWAVDRMIRLASPVSSAMLHRLPTKMGPLMRLSAPNKKRSLFLSRQPVEVQP